MFAVRFSTSFKTNKELEFNVLHLLSEVTQKRDEAIDANLAKSRFLASVSHDLRQPMQAVSLSLNTLQQLILRKAGGERAQQLVEDNLVGLQHSVQYLNSMFEALLDISRLDSGSQSVKIEFQSIEALFKNLEFEYSKIAQAEGIRIEMVIPKNFDKYQVKVDIHLLERLLRNLITNAIRYTPKGGVRLSARVKGNFIDIRVVDTGLGIPPSMRQKIFDEFIQLRNPSAREKNVGMGLGLSIARRLSILLGTKIRLHTHEKFGSVFAFELPARRALTAAQQRLASSSGDAILDSINGAFIVVIDDDARICEATKTMLELHGAEVIIAESGESAIQKMIFNSRMPDLILSDYRLIEETGLECIEKIRNEFNEDIPAVIITGDTAPDELKLLKEAGMEILYKPVPADALLVSIARNIRN
jgi:CheY-like chemotaxis protein